MKKLVIAAALCATALSGTTALAAGVQQPGAMARAPQAAPPPPPPPAPPPPGGPLAMADADRDGVTTRAEVAADADRRFAAMDADRDGKITREERRAFHARERAARGPGMPGMPGAPSMAGAPGVGTPPPPPPPPPPPGDRMDHKGPHRGDGMRGPGRERDETQAQFRERALRMFDRADTNHDGRVDRQERDAMALLMRARMADHHRRGGPGRPGGAPMAAPDGVPPGAPDAR
jgi:hypothetical protein